uniref:acylphosphatase n=1 Tax=Desulfobacca sp. TaxID=2067990 RepID=UPI00404B5277
MGFRPFVYRLARKYQLGGYVLNTAGAVELEVEGPPEKVVAFLEELTNAAPTLASIQEVVVRAAVPQGQET